MIERKAAPTLLEMARMYPVVTVTGPRQAGKTTLVKMAFPDKHYISLEPLHAREYAENDPAGFLREYQDGAILDEIQNVPSLLGYLQSDVDERPEPGRFILTGSQNFGLTHNVSQSLAGRTGMLTLLPPDLEELKRFANPPVDLMETLWTGSYPRIHDRNIPAGRWLQDYVTTYLQRDVRQILNVGDLRMFTTFLKLCAGRTAQEMNLSKLGSDTGASHNTMKSWLSILEASYIGHFMPAWHGNLRKRLVKTPKFHFMDSGLACHLLRIRDPHELRHHPLRGAIFESWAVSEIYKNLVHRGLEPALHYIRESRGIEVDLVREGSRSLFLVEMKSGETVRDDFLSSLMAVAETMRQSGADRNIETVAVYGGDRKERAGTVLPWSGVAERDWDA
jgi:predicted AAA+ superfamily ATPase